MEIHPLPMVVITGSVPKDDVQSYFRSIDCGATAVIQRPQGIGVNGHRKSVEKLVRTVKEMARLQVGYRAAGAW